MIKHLLPSKTCIVLSFFQVQFDINRNRIDFYDLKITKDHTRLNILTDLGKVLA